jgi:hypothetical protein
MSEFRTDEFEEFTIKKRGRVFFWRYWFDFEVFERVGAIRR